MLPLNLTELSFNGSFGGYFNQPLEKRVFPDKLLKLHLGVKFNHPIGENVFPESLETATRFSEMGLETTGMLDERALAT